MPKDGQKLRFNLAPADQEGWERRNWSSEYLGKVLLEASSAMSRERAGLVEGYLKATSALLKIGPEEMARRYTLCFRDRFEPQKNGGCAFVTEFWLEPKPAAPGKERDERQENE